MQSEFITEFKDQMLDRLAMAGVDTSVVDPVKFHDYCISKLKSEDLVIYNNVKQTNYDIDSLKLVDMVMYSKTKPIITGYNTLFHNHNKAENIPGGFLDYLKATRSAAKKQMHHHTNDTDRTLFNAFETKQLIMKLLANSYYGAFGQGSFHFFNVLLGPSVTAQGRQLISSAILGFEGFLGDNIFFYEFDELVQFIGNICKEEQDDEMVVETEFDIDAEAVAERLLSRCKFKLTETQEEYLNMVLENQTETGLQKLYFKNNLFKFLEVDVIKEAISDNLVVNGFHDANSPPEDIKEILAEISSILRYFVGYPYPYNAKTNHAATMTRKVVLVCDTDSNFLHVYPWLQYVCRVSDIDIPTIDNDTRVSIISIMTYFITQFIDEVFKILCANSNVPEAEHHRINMKSE